MLWPIVPRMLKIIFLVSGIVVAVHELSANGSVSYCFENAGLKTRQIVRFKVHNNQISGGKFVTEQYEDESKKASHFSGSKTGTVLVIEFKGKPPYPRPPKTDVLIWKMENNSLKIPMFGKNLETNKYSGYNAVFSTCKPG